MNESRGRQASLSRAVSKAPSLKGPRVLVVTNMYPNDQNTALGRFVKNQTDALDGLECEQDVLLIEGGRSRWNYLRAIGRIRREVSSGKHDLVHAYYGLCGFAAIWQRRVPVVVTFCGSDLNPGFAGERRAPLLSALVFALSQLASLRARACIVRSQAMLERIISPRARKRTLILASGIDLETFHPTPKEVARARLGWAPERKVALFVCADSRLPAVKRPELARSAVAEAQKQLPEMELIAVFGKPQSDLNDFYCAADLLLLTSANEGSPNVVREALACNLPVVSTRVGDVEDQIAGLQNCYACEPDPVQMGSRIVEVVRQGGRADSRQRMMKYSLTQTTKAILTLYRRVLAPKDAGLVLATGEDASR
jgi:teichuronic acid biosynthesis glycosyltransferase TuaC